MKKMDLCKLALLGIFLGTASSSLQANPQDLHTKQLLADNSDRYICSAYQNCGFCGGRCQIKNPKTPGLTPEEVKKAEEYQQEKEKKTDKEESDQNKCGSFCSATKDGNSRDKNDNSSTMKTKRDNLRK